jgi:predicted dinucleotide-binding enzyme
MARAAQRRAVANNRRRLAERGMSRYEVRGLAGDKELVRTLARRLAGDDAAATRLRNELARQLGDQPVRRGGIYEALRRSPLVGADLQIERDPSTGRDIDL